jgi:hypothetical protein
MAGGIFRGFVTKCIAAAGIHVVSILPSYGCDAELFLDQFSADAGKTWSTPFFLNSTEPVTSCSIIATKTASTYRLCLFIVALPSPRLGHGLEPGVQDRNIFAHNPPDHSL